MTKLILTGTTGNLGSRVLAYLLSVLPPKDLIVSVFNPDSSAAEELKKKGADVRAGDFNKPESLERAFRGGDKLFLVSVPSFNDAERVAAHHNAITAAKAVGVKHIYYTSLAMASTSKAGVMQAHLNTEEELKKSGITYTIIREGNYTDNLPIFLGFWQKTDTEVVVAGDGGINWVSWVDLAVGTAKILADASDEYKNKTVNLVGPKLINLEETTKSVSNILGRNITFRKVTLDEWLARHSDKIHAKAWSSSYPGLDAGDWEIVDPLLEKLVGRPLITFEERAREILLGGRDQTDLVATKHNYLS